MWWLAWALVALLAPAAAQGVGVGGRVGVRRLLFEYGKVGTQTIQCACEKAGYTQGFRRDVSHLEPCDKLPF